MWQKCLPLWCARVPVMREYTHLVRLEMLINQGVVLRFES